MKKMDLFFRSFYIYYIIVLGIDFSAVILGWEPVVWISVVIVLGMITFFICYGLSLLMCPDCGRFFSMKEIDRRFVGERLISKEIQVTENRYYTVNGKNHLVQVKRPETRYAEVNVYHCLQRCEACGYERTVEKTVEK